jgi:flagellar hook-associated protein 1 FlgK
MASQFFGLNIAYSGLLASNAALNTTTNNIANVSTEGYSRQYVVQQAAVALRVFETYGCAGAGVDTLAIERYRDEFYDDKYWNNQTRVGEFKSKEYYMGQVETYFNDDGTSGFESVFNNFMKTGLKTLALDPSNTTARAQFIDYGSTLCEYFNSMSGEMQAIQKDINAEIKIKVDDINSIASRIATLNEQINTIELSGTTANELRDRRALMIDQLSKIVAVDVKETPMVDGNNPDRETGGNNFIVKIAGGQTLVNGYEYRQLECVSRRNFEKVNQTDIEGLYDLKWDNGSSFNIYNVSMGGELMGLFQMRDGNSKEGFEGSITEISTTTNAAGNGVDTITVQVSADYLQNLHKCNLSDTGGKISLGNQEYYYDTWEFQASYDENGKEVYSYVFTLSDSSLNEQRVTNNRLGLTASVGESVNYQGIPYYMKQMNEWVRTFSQKYNDLLASGYDLYDNKGINMFTGDMETQADQYKLPDDSNYNLLAVLEQEAAKLMAADPTLTREAAINQIKTRKDGNGKPINLISVGVADDSYYRLTAGNIAVRNALLNDPGLLATADQPVSAEGAEQGEILDQLQDMINNKDKMSFRGSNASEFLQCILSDVALNTSRAQNFASTYTNMGNAIETQRMSISGVDEDEEAVNLVKYQNSYNLASKMIQVLTEIYDRLILETGV